MKMTHDVILFNRYNGSEPEWTYAGTMSLQTANQVPDARDIAACFFDGNGERQTWLVVIHYADGDRAAIEVQF